MGVSLGLLAGYSRNPVFDEIPMRLLDVVLAIPGLIFVLLFVSMFGPKPWLIVACVAVAFTPSLARIARGATLDIARREYIEWADANGISRRWILFREILPNIATPVMVEVGVRLRYSISVIAAVSFLGFGIQPPAADWGLMVNENRLALYSQPLALLAPVVCISIFTLGSNLIAEGIARTIGRVRQKE
jgi:peptide/nickel transport system permease protein